MADNVTAVIIDNGSALMKAGLGGEDAPRAAVPSIVGRTRHPGVNPTILGNTSDRFCGEEAVRQQGLLSLSHPVQRGIITDWNAIEALWHHALFDSLNVACEEHPAFLTEAPDNSRADRERMTQVMFEVFSAPALAIGNTSVLSLYATGRSTGVVVDSGAGRTHIGPIWEGYSMQHFCRRIDFAGDDMTAEIQQRLRSEGYPFSTPRDVASLDPLKRDMCYVALNAEKERAYSQQSKSIERLFKLPDGQEVYMNDARFMLPEVFFSPSLVQSGSYVDAQQRPAGWHSVVNETIALCNRSIQAEMYGNVVLAGGNTLFPHLDERMQKEMSYLAPKGTVVKCVAFPNRQYAAWIGASIVASLSTFPCMWVSKSEYDDYGASIIHRKC